MKLLSTAVCILIFASSYSQSVAINTDGTVAHTSAILDIKSINKGMLIPRMTTIQRTAIATPATAAGLLVYDTDTNSFWYYNGSAWSNLSASGLSGSGVTNYVSKFTASNTIGNSKLFDNGTNIGIGTTTPGNTLHVFKGSAGSTTIGYGDAPLIVENSTNCFINILAPGSKETGILFGNEFNNVEGGIIYNDPANPYGLQFRTGGNFTRTVLTGTGDLGVGTTTPENKLHVFKGSAGAVTGWPQAPLIVEGSTDNYINILAPDAAATGILFGKPQSNISGGIIYNNISGTNPNGFDFRTNGNVTRMVLDNLGNLGIGTSSPTSKLHAVDGSGGIGVHGTSFGTGIGVRGSGGNYGIYGTGDDNGVYGYSIYGRGVYGQSTDYEGGRFQSQTGNGLWAKTVSGGYAGVFEGNVVTYGTYTLSDKNLKKDIKEFTNAMDIINKLKPKKYDFRNDGKYASLNLPKGDHFGLLAQELEEVLPNLVKECSHEIYDKVPGHEAIRLSQDGKVIPVKEQNYGKETIKIKAVNYVELIPVLIKGMQEQQQQIDLLLKRIEALEKK